MRPKIWLSAALCASVLLAAPAGAEDLYVRNHRFPGYRTGKGLDMQVDLAALTAALEMPCLRSEGTLRLGQSGENDTQEILRVQVGDTSIPFSKGPGGELMVPLQAIMEALGGQVKVNRDLNLVDVQLPKGALPVATRKDDPPPSDPTPSGPVSTSLAGARTNPDFRPTQDQHSQTYGFQTSDGRWAIPPSFHDADRFRFGLAAVREDKGTSQSVKTSNQYVIIGGGYKDLSEADKRRFDAARKVRVTTNRIPGQWGYIDARGVWVLPPQFDAAGAFEMQELEGKRQLAARVKKDGAYIYIDTQGNKLGTATAKSRSDLSSALTVRPETVDLELRPGQKKTLFSITAGGNGGGFSLRPDPTFRTAGFDFSPYSGGLRGRAQITVQAGKNCRPGVYRGVIGVVDGNRSESKIPVTITVGP